MDQFLGGRSPQSFWAVFRDKLGTVLPLDVGFNGGRLEAYSNNGVWTKVALHAARQACRECGLLTQKEYLRIDLIGYDRREDQSCPNWDLRVAFEHENSDDWDDEICKLVHVVADLCIVASYYRDIEQTISKLETTIEVMGDRMNRVPGRKWLFVFGPRCVNSRDPFKAYSWDESVGLIDISDDDELIPDRWRPKA